MINKRFLESAVFMIAAAACAIGYIFFGTDTVVSFFGLVIINEIREVQEMLK